MPKKATPRLARKKQFALYWVTTDDGDEDFFVVASSAVTAERFFEKNLGYERGDADAERIKALPDHLQDGTGWRDDPRGAFIGEPYYASKELLVACGAEIAEQRSDSRRELMGEATFDVRFGRRVFRPGDVITNASRGIGTTEPGRLAVFRGEKKTSRFPSWWEWELELSPHLEKRVEDRGFTEVDLRAMLEHATGYRKDVVEDRFVIETRHKRRRWEVVVEPDETDLLLVVVTCTE